MSSSSLSNISNDERNATTDRTIRFLLDKINELEGRLPEHRPGKIEVRNGKTYLLHYDKLLEEYPAINITPEQFYNKKLEPNHGLFEWNQFYHTDKMVYKPPTIVENKPAILSGPAKKHDDDLASIQGHMAATTRWYDTLADEIVDSADCKTALGQRVLGFLDTIKRLAANDVSKITDMRSKVHLDAMGIRNIKDDTDAILRMDDIIEKRAKQDLFDKTYKKPSDKDKDGKGFKPKKPATASTPSPSGGGQDKKSPTPAKSEQKTDRKEHRKPSGGFKPKYGEQTTTADEGKGTEKSQ